MITESHWGLDRKLLEGIREAIHHDHDEFTWQIFAEAVTKGAFSSVSSRRRNELLQRLETQIDGEYVDEGDIEAYCDEVDKYGGFDGDDDPFY